MKISFLLVLICVWCFVDGSAMHDVGISGGKPVNIVDAPWMVRVKRNNRDDLWCGGAIVHKISVLTSLTCLLKLYIHDLGLTYSSAKGELATSGVEDQDSRWMVELLQSNGLNMRVTVGTDDANKGGKDYTAWRFFYVPQFKLGLIPPDWDIPVLQVRKKFEFNDRVKLIPLAHKIPNHGAIVETFGFGNTENGKPSKQLLSVKLQLVAHEKCKNILKEKNYNLTERMICVGGEKGTGIAKGDEGGPLVFEGKLIGLASWVGTGEAGFPSVFVSVPSMMNFIEYILNSTLIS